MAKTFAEFKELAKHDGARLVTEGVTDTKGLADAVSFEMKSAGRSELEYDIQKNMEHKAAMLETKANEIMHTTNTGFGAELVPGNILMTDFIDLIPAASPLMAFFQGGFHGKTLAKKQDVAVLGELPLHQLKAEQTGGALGFAQGLGKQPTKLVTIEQKQRFFSVDISEYEQTFAITDVVALVKRKLAASSANTMVSDVLNGDTVATANTNINLIDGTPAATNSYLAANGLRKQAFTDSTATDAGTFAFADYLTLIKALGFNASNKQDLVFIHSLNAEVAALGIDEFRQAYVNGQLSSAITGKLPNFLGASVTTDRFLGEANTAGKVSATPANNVKGQVVCAHKMAVQWGTNGDYYMEIYRVPGSGYQVIGWYFMGHAIAGLTEIGAPTVSSLYNIA
jgi:hypothetical protein